MHATIPARSSRLLGTLDAAFETRPDGTILVRASEPLPPYADTLIDRLEQWARLTPDTPFLAERPKTGVGWRAVTYAETYDKVMRIASALLARGLSAEEPVLILSGNGIEHALLSLGGMAAGVPTCPMSTAYSLVSSDLGKLDYGLTLLTPGLVFAAEGRAYVRALAKARGLGIEIAVVDAEGLEFDATSFQSLAEGPITSAGLSARAQIGPDTIARFLLTSGSTGYPKAVTNTQRMLCANQVMLSEALTILAHEPVLLDWLPWSHTFGSNHNLGIALYNGGTFHIDEGKPMPHGIGATIANLREIAPTVYFNVPKGFEALLPFLREDEALRRTFFSRLKLLFYAGAGLSRPVWDAYQTLAIETIGRVVPMVTGLGATETAPSALMNVRESDRPGIVGMPNKGIELKLVPNAGKLEARVRGPSITPGYWRRPDLTQSAFDEEGFYKLGDALRWAEPNNPAAGFEFDGRVAEDFKLATGTWVSVGPMRLAFVEKFDPLVRDAVATGHDRDDVGMLVFPDEQAVRKLAPHLPRDTPFAEVLADRAVTAVFRERLAAAARNSTGSSSRVARIALQARPPSIDRGEATDKGSLNQRAVLANRAAEVEALYAERAPPHVVTL
jgi:feruloyl-CoA synthase